MQLTALSGGDAAVFVGVKFVLGWFPICLWYSSTGNFHAHNWRKNV